MNGTTELFALPPSAAKPNTTNFRMGLNLLMHVLGSSGNPSSPEIAYLRTVFPVAVLATEKADGLPVTGETLRRFLTHPHDAAQLLTPSPMLPVEHLGHIRECLLNNAESHAAAIQWLEGKIPSILVTPDDIPLALFNPLRIRVNNYLNTHTDIPSDSPVAICLTEACVMLSANQHALHASSIIGLLNSDHTRSGHLITGCPDGLARTAIDSALKDPIGSETCRCIASEAFFNHFK